MTTFLHINERESQPGSRPNWLSWVFTESKRSQEIIVTNPPGNAISLANYQQGAFCHGVANLY